MKTEQAVQQLETLKLRALDVLDQDPNLQHAVVVSFLAAMKCNAKHAPEAMTEAARVMGEALENFEDGGIFAK
jgi:hypothetical protein